MPPRLTLQHTFFTAFILAILFHIFLFSSITYILPATSRTQSPKINFFGSILNPRDFDFLSDKMKHPIKDEANLQAVIHEKKIYGFEIEKPSSIYSKIKQTVKPENYFSENSQETKIDHKPSDRAPYNKLSIDQ